MLELSGQEKVCPSCAKKFYAESKVVKETFCGEETVCSPVEEKTIDDDCQILEFCSEECLEEYRSKVPECEYVPGWKKLMKRINKAGSDSGIAGARQHDIREKR